MFGCWYWGVALDIRAFPGPNNPNLGVWLVVALGKCIRARYDGGGRTAKKRNLQSRGVSLEIGVIFASVPLRSSRPEARATRRSGGTLATLVRPTPGLPPSIAPHARRRQPPLHLLIPTVSPLVSWLSPTPLISASTSMCRNRTGFSSWRTYPRAPVTFARRRCVPQDPVPLPWARIRHVPSLSIFYLVNLPPFMFCCYLCARIWLWFDDDMVLTSYLIAV
jgi:hypothetical protein